MKRNTFKFCIVLSFFIIPLLFTSCEEEGLSIDERIDSFMDDINDGKDPSGNFVSSSQLALNDDSFTGAIFAPAKRPFTWDENTALKTSKTRTGIIHSNVDDPAVVFYLEKEVLSGLVGGEDWKIVAVVIDGGTPIPNVLP